MPGTSLSDAITAVETAQTQLVNDQQIQANAVTAVASAQAKLDTANTAKTSADSTVSTDVAAFNTSLDGLIAAATAAKL